jgi:hypothetical protein
MAAVGLGAGLPSRLLSAQGDMGRPPGQGRDIHGPQRVTGGNATRREGTASQPRRQQAWQRRALLSTVHQGGCDSLFGLGPIGAAGGRHRLQACRDCAACHNGSRDCSDHVERHLRPGRWRTLYARPGARGGNIVGKPCRRPNRQETALPQPRVASSPREAAQGWLSRTTPTGIRFGVPH